MKLPNREHAVLHQFGYAAENWERLASDIRKYHLESEVDSERSTPYGMRYEIAAELLSPRGRGLLVRTIWQIDEGSDVPRLITLIPE